MIKSFSVPEFILIHAAVNGDEKAFIQLMKKYDGRIRAMGMSFFKNETDCDDFIQEVYIKVFSGLKTFRRESLFSTWLIRIAYNTAINAVNRRIEYLSIPENHEIMDLSAGPEEIEIRKLTSEVIRESVKELPERFRACLDFYFFYDMSYQEISEVMGLPINTVKSHVFRAKKMLKEKIEKNL